VIRVASLFPAATEIAFAIGAGEQLVGVSHACDYPPEARQRKAITRARFDPSEMSSREIYRQKIDTNRSFGSVFRLDESALWGLRANVVITQGPGDVSLVSLPGVRAIAEGLNPRPTLLILYPRHLDDVFDDHSRVGFAVGRLQEARELLDRMQARIVAVEKTVSGVRRPHVALLHWLDPLFAGGFWSSQVIEIAGGRDVLNMAGLPPEQVDWQMLRRRDPDVLVIACEDMGIQRIREEMRLLTDRPGWHELSAARWRRVFIGDGAVFTRAGPRLIEGLEALAWATHPNRFPKPRREVLQPLAY